jgi:hypothetical protein
MLLSRRAFTTSPIESTPRRRSSARTGRWQTLVGHERHSSIVCSGCNANDGGRRDLADRRVFRGFALEDHLASVVALRKDADQAFAFEH